MFCENCGTKLPDGAKFCAKCGTKQHLSAEQTPSNNNVNNSVNTQLVPAKCTNCGEQLTVNPEQQAAVCPFCNSAYVVEQAINNYNAQTTERMNIDEKQLDEQVQNIQNEPSKNDTQKEASIFKYMSKPGGCGKVILFLFIALGVLVNLFSSPKDKQDSKPSATQTQQVQSGKQGTDKKATQRKDFGKVDDFWKFIEDEMATKKDSGFSIVRGKEGLLTKKNSTRTILYNNRKIGAGGSILTDISGDKVDKVIIYLLRGELGDDIAFYGFALRCLLTVRATNPDLSNKDAQTLLKEVHAISDNYKIEGKWKKTHNGVEYEFENEIPSGGGLRFTAEIAKPK